MEMIIWSCASLSDQNMKVRMEVDAISESLDDCYDAGHQLLL